MKKIAPPGPCDAFVEDLRRSNLVDRRRLDSLLPVVFKKNPRVEPGALAKFLMAQGLLSEFQAQRLLSGHCDLIHGPYVLLAEAGSGSMGTVYRALSRKDQREYSLAIIPRRSTWDANRAKTVVRGFEACQHPGIVPFADVGTSGNLHYLAWPLVGGLSLEQVVRDQGRLAPGLAAYYGLHIAEALEYCHRLGLVHGLLKPSNLIVSDGHQIRIVDFGIRSILNETELMDTLVGSKVSSGLDCASPESVQNPTNQTPASDRYSLGCVLYFMLTGEYPFQREASARDKILAHQTREPTALRERSPDVPAALADAVHTLLAKNPESRFANSADVVAALRPFAEAPAPEAPLKSRNGLKNGATRKSKPPAVAPDTRLAGSENGTGHAFALTDAPPDPDLADAAIHLPPSVSSSQWFFVFISLFFLIGFIAAAVFFLRA